MQQQPLLQVDMLLTSKERSRRAASSAGVCMDSEVQGHCALAA
jgi:hypothetical protein